MTKTRSGKSSFAKVLFNSNKTAFFHHQNESTKMFKNYRSLAFQTVFLALTGLQLIFVPNLFLTTFGFDTTTEIWIKVLGIVVLALAIVYYGINRHGNTEMVSTSVLARTFAGASFVLLVILGQAKMSLLVFAGLDLATAFWTWLELKKTEK